MTLSRALLSTALGLTLASCAMDGAPASSISLASSPVESVEGANRAAATSLQVASLETGSQTMTDASPVVRKGTVLWRRSGDEIELPPTPRVSEEISRLKNTIAEMRGDTSQQMNALEDRLAGNQMQQAQTLAALKEEQTRTGQELRTQTAEAVTTVASLAKQGMQSTGDMAKLTSEQLAQLETRLQGTSSDAREARQIAATAETNAKTYTSQQLAAQNTQLNALSNQITSQLASNQQVTTAQLEALKSETATRLAAAREVQGAQMAALSQQVTTNQQLTAIQIAQIQKITTENRALAQSEVTNVAAALRQYADAQMQQAMATTSATMLNLAKATDQSVANLSQQTNRRLGLMWQASSKQAEKMAEQKANIVATSLLALQKQTEEQRLTPDQIRQISEKTVADSTPEFRALALRTMQESQDYIRTIARTAVQDKDPAMQQALAQAARDVITKDDQVVFAIRKAVADELQGAVADNSNPSTKLGQDRGRNADGSEQLDPNRLRIAQLLSPGTNHAAPDAAAMSDADLAAISPAAGTAPQDGGQQSWSAKGTSLMRARNRADWMDIRQYKVVVHEDGQTLEELLTKVLKHAEPFTGPWQVRWKVSEENKDLMQEKFSLDAETNFEDFVSYLAQYVVNDRGVKLSFNLFDNERIIVISD